MKLTIKQLKTLVNEAPRHSYKYIPDKEAFEAAVHHFVETRYEVGDTLTTNDVRWDFGVAFNRGSNDLLDVDKDLTQILPAMYKDVKPYNHSKLQSAIRNALRNALLTSPDLEHIGGDTFERV